MNQRNQLSQPLAVAVLALISVCHFCSGEVRLVEPGRPNAIVILPDTPEPLTRLAASELQEYLSKLSKVRVTVTNATEANRAAPGQPLILLGGPARNPIVRQMRESGVVAIPELKAEGFLLKTATWQQRPVVIVAANDDAGTLYGTYELLERLGITFRLTGDIVPAPSDVLSFPDLDSASSPAFTRRGFLHTLCFDSASAFAWSDYKSFIDQMARMKCNYLQIWWFAYAPWNKFSVRGETKWIGDVSAKESGYNSWVYGGFGSRTMDDVTIGREHFKDHSHMAPLEMQHVQSPEEAFATSEDLLKRVIAYAATRNIKAWLVVELASMPPNLARHGEIVGETPFNYVFGSFVHPQDPLALEIQVAQLKGLAETYPQAEGIFFNFAELYPELANEKHRAFFEHERPRFHDLRQLSIPWGAALANIYDVKVDQLVDSNIGYFDLFARLLQSRDQVSPGTRLGLMTIGRGYALPLFHKLLPEKVPFASLESSGVWTMLGMPMSYFGGMGQRERIIQPRVDDDFDMLGMQFSVGQYARKDRIFSDGARLGVSGFAGQVERARGTEFNSSFMARAAWEPELTPEAFYRDSAQRMFGSAAADEMYRTFMKLEEAQEYLGYYEFDGGYGTLLCCSGIREVNATHQYWRQKNPYGGPSVRSWKSLIAAASDFIMRRERIIQLVDEALSNLRKAQSNVAPQGQYELGYLINRTEVYRETFAGLNLFRSGMVQFDEAFRSPSTDPGPSVERMRSGLEKMRQGRELFIHAARHYAELVDHISDLAVLYHVNARILLGTELVLQFLDDIANCHEGKPYGAKVPFERLYPRRPDQGIEN